MILLSYVLEPATVTSIIPDHPPAPDPRHLEPADAVPPNPPESPIVIQGRLTKVVTRHGNNQTYPVKGQTVSVLYTLTISGKFIEHEIDAENPFVTKVGVGAVIQGWDIGLVTMSLGEKCTLSVPPELGYGKQGSGDDVPGDATLTFDIELLKIE